MRLFLAVFVLMTTARPLTAAPIAVAQAVQRALFTHPQSQLAAAVVDEARGERRSAAALPPPKLFIRWDDIPSGSGMAAYEEKRVGFSQEFDFPLKYVWDVKGADLSVSRAQIKSRIILLDLEAAVKQAYLEAWASAERTRILKDYRDTLDVYCQRIQAMGERGEYSPLDARGCRVNARQANLKYLAVQRSNAASMTHLAKLLNLAVDEIELISPLESDPIDTTLLAAGKPLFDNPQIVEIKTELRLREWRKTSAKYDWLPELQLTYFDRVRLDRPDRNSWAFELEMTIPVWFGWGGVGGIQAAQADLSRAQAELADVQLTLTADYLRLEQEIKSAFERCEFYRQEMIPLVKDKTQSAKKSLQLGGAACEDFLKVWTEQKEALLKEVDVKSELYQKKIEIDKLRGASVVR